MDVFDLQAKFGFDSSEFNKGIEDAKGKLETFSGKLKNGLGTIAKVGTAAIGAASTAAVAFGKTSVDAGMKFDSSMAQVAATMGKTVDEIGDLREFAQKMGSTTAFSASQAADALNYMALAGYEAETSMTMLPNVLNLAAAGGIELATASDMVTDASSALGLSLDDTKIMINQMAVASSKTNTSVAQLGEAILTVGGTAKNLRGGTQELTQVLGLMADNGIKASESGTHLRNIMLAMTPSTDAAVAAFEELGLKTYDDTGKLRSMSDIFGDLSAAMDGMTDEKKTQILSDIFNKTDLSAVNALISTNAERWTEVSEAIGDSDKAAEKMAKTQLDNLAGDITLFQSALEGAQIAVSDSLTPTLREFVQFGTEGLSELTESFLDGGVGGAIDKLGELISEALDKLMPYVIDIVGTSAETIVKMIPKIFDIIEENAPQIINMASSLINTMIQWLQSAPEIVSLAVQLITGIGKAVVDNLPILASTAESLLLQLTDYLSKNLPKATPKIVKFISKFAEKLTDPKTITFLVDTAVVLVTAIADGLIAAMPVLIENAPVIIENLTEAVMENFPKLVDLAWNLITEFTNAILVNMPQIVESGKSIIDNIGLGITSMILTLNEKAKEINETIETKIKEAFQEYIRLGKDIINKLLDGIKALQKKMTEKAVELMTLMTTGIAGEFEKVKEKGKELLVKIVAGIAEVQHKVKEKALELIALLTAGIAEKFEEVKNKGRELVDKVKDGISDKFESIKETGRNIVNRVKDGIFDVINSAKEWGSDLINNFIEGLTSGNALTQTVSKIAGNIDDFLGFSEPEKGPLSDFHESAPDMIDMFVKGLKDSEGKLKTQLQSTASIISNGFTATEIKGSTSRAEVTNIYNITVASGTISSDYDADRAAHRMSERLAFIQTQNRRAVGI